MIRLRSILIQYRIVLYLLYPLLLVVTFIMAARNKDWRYLLERVGIYRGTYPSDSIWFHAASVGEVNGIMPLLRKMAECNPSQNYLITTSTPTGGAAAISRMPANTVHAYLPMDLPGAVRRFLNKTRPSSAIIMETELWANLYYSCDKRNIPISIINARLSKRTLKTNAWMYRLYAETLSHVKKILARSDVDANAFMTIGATSSKIKVLGNLKHAVADTADVQLIEDLNRPYVLAASTHKNEEEILARLWTENSPDMLLVIAPRHPIRRDSIISSIKRYTENYAVRSRNEPVTADTQIYLADTLGELRPLIKGADIVFMGGSLVPIGGHNVIEVVQFGKPLLFGPHMDNFMEEAELLTGRGIAKQITNADELMAEIKKITVDENRIKQIEMESRRLTDENANILDRYIKALLEPIELYQPGRFIKD
jgi:3-deoxy-D-manno-octulosonic-acid transferase